MIDIREYISSLIKKNESIIEELDLDWKIQKESLQERLLSGDKTALDNLEKVICFSVQPNMITLKVLKIEQQIERLMSFSAAVAEQERVEDQYSQRLIDAMLVLLKKRNRVMTEATTYKLNKPLLETGDLVFAKYWPNNDKALDPTWEHGVIEQSVIEHEDIDGYGPSRVYCVGFDSGQKMNGIKEHQVILDKEYILSKESDWKRIGVKRVVDSDSSDQWAREVGWYVARDQPFVHLMDALQACDTCTLIGKGREVQESDFIFPREWKGVITNIATHSKALTDYHLSRLRVIHTNGRLADPKMQQIGRALLSLTKPSLLDTELLLSRSWTVARGHYFDRNTGGMRDSVFMYALLKQCIDAKFIRHQICIFFIGSEGRLDDFLIKTPIFRVGYVATIRKSPQESMMKYLQSNKPDNIIDFMFIFIKCAKGNHTIQREVASRDAPFKEFLVQYADDRGASVKSLRVKHNDKTLFLSSIGKKTPEQLGIGDDDIIEITIMQSTPIEAIKEQPKQSSPKGKNKKHKKSKKKQPVQIAPPEDLKGEHSKLLGKLHEEAESQFKEIRQRLNAMNLERTKPKQRTSPSKAKSVEVVDNPLGDDQLGGKAGKTQFIIQVGEVSNLYKTTKPTAGRGRRRDDTLIDLHGLTAEEAVYRLDKHLPNWIDTAMKGTYPFVIPVKIVCGGGSQILAEVVENWIKQTDHVANAPKNMYS